MKTDMISASLAYLLMFAGLVEQSMMAACTLGLANAWARHNAHTHPAQSLPQA